MTDPVAASVPLVLLLVSRTVAVTITLTLIVVRLRDARNQPKQAVVS